MLPIFSCMLLSCTEAEDNIEGNRETTVSIHITTNGITDLNATRVRGGEKAAAIENGEKGEFINTLCIFIVDAETGQIEMKISPDLTGTKAETGDLVDYTSGEMELRAGKKNVYAFANWDNTESAEWRAIINKETGDVITENDLSFSIDDPASKVDIAKGKYIPMSGKLEGIAIGDMNGKYFDNNLISVVLDRLVGKVMITVVGDGETDIDINRLLFLGTADNVTLFPKAVGDSWGEITFEKEKGIDSGSGVELSANRIASNSAGEEIATFYINESYRTKSSDNEISEKGYTLMLEMERNDNYDKYDGSRYVAMTMTQDVPRNYIFPIKLKLDSYDIELEIEAKTAPIDFTEEVNYYTDAEWHEDGDGYYMITLRDITSSFTITPKLIKNTNDVSEEVRDGVTWEWTCMDKELQCTPQEDGTLNVTGLTATPNYAYNFIVEVSWEMPMNELTVRHSRRYNVRVVLKEGNIQLR
ncbi:MAG: hypothetical protein LUC91_09415 [Prevotella sp.]|nr:hypothetical protein [Prevotella sp.]